MEDQDRETPGADQVVARAVAEGGPVPAGEVIGERLIILQAGSHLQVLDMGATLEEGLGHHMGEVEVEMIPAVHRMGLGAEEVPEHCSYRHQQVHTFLRLLGRLRRLAEEALVPYMTTGGQ